MTFFACTTAKEPGPERLRRNQSRKSDPRLNNSFVINSLFTLAHYILARSFPFCKTECGKKPWNFRNVRIFRKKGGRWTFFWGKREGKVLTGRTKALGAGTEHSFPIMSAQRKKSLGPPFPKGGGGLGAKPPNRTPAECGTSKHIKAQEGRPNSVWP